jgi:hypothetical protein
LLVGLLLLVGVVVLFGASRTAQPHIVLSQEDRSDHFIRETLGLWLGDTGDAERCAREMQNRGFDSLDMLPLLSAGDKDLLPGCRLQRIADAAARGLMLSEWISALGVDASSAARYAILLDAAGFKIDRLDALGTVDGLNLMAGSLQFADNDARKIAAAAATALPAPQALDASSSAPAVPASLRVEFSGPPLARPDSLLTPAQRELEPIRDVMPSHLADRASARALVHVAGRVATTSKKSVMVASTKVQVSA